MKTLTVYQVSEMLADDCDPAAEREKERLAFEAKIQAEINRIEAAL